MKLFEMFPTQHREHFTLSRCFRPVSHKITLLIKKEKRFRFSFFDCLLNCFTVKSVGVGDNENPFAYAESML